MGSLRLLRLTFGHLRFRSMSLRTFANIRGRSAWRWPIPATSN